ncbi:MAG: peptidase S41, partial [Muribaculaceae bacterium]|nr:peptidase S41 [Muribaculaceae bacterium]
MSDLLDELQDGHVNLSSRFSTSYYRKWWTDYPQDFNLRTLQQYYLDFDYMSVSGMNYKMLPDSIGYIYCPSFSNQISETSLDYVFAVLYGVEKAKGMIIDIRNNGGGLLTNINTLVGRFIDKEICGGYIRHKTGPSSNAFSEPYKITFKPADNTHVRYQGPIIVLTNRSCYSAANNFVAVMKSLPNVRICGARTGGGGGLPFSSELPNGWAIRFSACPITDSDDKPTEFGIDPSKGYEVHCTEEELAQGKDAILDFAIEVYRKAFEAADKKTQRSFN